MAPGKSPAFSFYAKDFLTGTATMSLAEVGAYVKLLAYEWDSGSVPKSAAARARILACSTAQEKAIWATLVEKFVLVEPGYLNARLEEERDKQAEYRRRQSDKGKASAATRRQPNSNHGSTTVQPASQPEGQPKVNSSSSSSFSKEHDPSKNDGSRSLRPRALIVNAVEFERKHGHHLSGFCDWCCFPIDLVERLERKIPGNDDGLKRTQITQWAEQIRLKWSTAIIPDGSDYEFWTNRWTETHGGSRPATATLKAVRADRAIDEAFR